MNRWFGRITPERTRAELLAEARTLAVKFRVLELKSQALAERALLDAKHYGELARHYEALNHQGEI
jgi:hypothetical protein